MNPLYNIGIRLYKAGAKAASVRSAKAKEMLRGQRDVFRVLKEAQAAIAPDGFDEWIHAASLGEFEQGRPIIERVRRNHPEKKILLTFFSPSGFNVRKNYDKADVVAYLPFDTPGNVKKFLDLARPKKAIFVKYEFWGNYLEELQKRHVSTYIISAIFRPGQVFFKPWGGMFRKMLGKFTRLYVQDDKSRELLKGIGVENVEVTGDTRFDRVSDIRNAAKRIPPIETWRGEGGLCIVGGSTWAPDEEILLPWLSENPEIKAIIAPHEFDSERLKSMMMKAGEGTALMSEVLKEGKVGQNVRLIIVDSFGLLSSLYRYGDVAYVGGGFGAGIHNINEAAVYGVPVVFGPKYQKFKEAVDMTELGGAYSVRSVSEGREILTRLVNDDELRMNSGTKAASYIKDNIGASDRIYGDLFAE